MNLAAAQENIEQQKKLAKATESEEHHGVLQSKETNTDAGRSQKSKSGKPPTGHPTKHTPLHERFTLSSTNVESIDTAKSHQLGPQPADEQQLDSQKENKNPFEKPVRSKVTEEARSSAIQVTSKEQADSPVENHELAQKIVHTEDTKEVRAPESKDVKPTKGDSSKVAQQEELHGFDRAIAELKKIAKAKIQTQEQSIKEEKTTITKTKKRKDIVMYDASKVRKAPALPPGEVKTEIENVSSRRSREYRHDDRSGSKNRVSIDLRSRSVILMNPSTRLTTSLVG